MVRENIVICYEGIQRIYRNAIVGYVRSRFQAAFPVDYAAKLRSPFQKEWDEIVKNASISRTTGELASKIQDDFDFLSVNHFFNLFDSYFDQLVVYKDSISIEQKRKQKQALLTWMKTVKSLRDPLSHPGEEDFTKEDAFQLLDCARRVLLGVDLQEGALNLKKLIDEVYSPLASSRLALEDCLPPRESIVVDFIGRDKELTDLRDWFFDPVSRRWALAGEGGKGKSALAYNFAVEVKMSAPEPYQAVFWMSAKKRKFLEGATVSIESPDFSDLDSALISLLVNYGWVEEIAFPIETKRKLVLELLDKFPALLVVDDVDSIESENEDVIEFFSLQLPTTRSKVLFTSRRTIFGMGNATTYVSGFNEIDAERFIYSRCQLTGLDVALFSKKIVQKIVKITEGSPLYIEDLVRLTAIVNSVSDVIKIWEERGGHEARKYALGRECEILTTNARKILLAASIWSGPVSFSEIEAVTGSSRETITAGLQEVQRLFLAPKPRLIDGEQRFEINLNIRRLVREVYGATQEYRRIQIAYKTISDGVSNVGMGDVGALIKQALYLLRVFKYQEAEDTLLKALNKYPSHPDLIGFLGLVYKSWDPPRLTDAREKFLRASQLRCAKQEMYEQWCWMELREQEWVKAFEASEKGLKVLFNNKTLLYLAGYSKNRLARELQKGLHHGRAEREIVESRKYLEKALGITDDLDSKEKALSPKIYRALVVVCDMASDVKGIKEYFKLWLNECPNDPDAESEWDRISKKYNLSH